MSSYVHTNFQDKTHQVGVFLVLKVHIFTSNVSLSSQNVTDLEKLGGISGRVAIFVGKIPV